MQTLPNKMYYRAGTLGEGSYGAVACVYDDDGNEFAAKVGGTPSSDLIHPNAVPHLHSLTTFSWVLARSLVATRRTRVRSLAAASTSAACAKSRCSASSTARTRE